MATAWWGWPLAAALGFGVLLGGLGGGLVGLLTRKLHGVYFAIATLAVAEFTRVALELWRYQRTIDGELVGPDGPNGFNGIRRAFEDGWDPQAFMILIWTLLVATLLVLMLFERSRAVVAVEPARSCAGARASTDDASACVSRPQPVASPAWAAGSMPTSTPISSRGCSTSCWACTRWPMG